MHTSFLYLAMILHIALLLIGFAFLIKGADFLVEGASAIAKRVGIRDIVIGLTIVAFGTSSPELVVNILAAISGSTDLAIGNIIGSNISNIFLILGAVAVVYPLRVKRGTVWKEIPLTVLAALAVLFLLNDHIIDGGPMSVLTRTDGLVLLLFFLIFMYYSYGISKVSGSSEREGTVKLHSLPISSAMIIGGISGLTIGGKLIVDNAVSLATTWGLSQSLIGLTILALGTSLPELATSVVAALKKKSDIAIGNVVGSNIFNILFVLAITSTIRPLPITPHINFDLFVMLAASFLLFLLMFVGKRRVLERSQGYMFLFLYATYIIYIVMRN